MTLSGHLRQCPGGAIIFGDLIGKLGVPLIERLKCWDIGKTMRIRDDD
jgi:hypothetical protein